MPSASLTEAQNFVHLRDGHIVPVAALRLVWSMEDAGFRFRATPDGALHVAPFELLGADQVASLRRWKPHVVALVRYCERTDLDAHLRTFGRALDARTR